MGYVCRRMGVPGGIMNASLPTVAALTPKEIEELTGLMAGSPMLRRLRALAHLREGGELEQGAETGRETGRPAHADAVDEDLIDAAGKRGDPVLENAHEAGVDFVEVELVGEETDGPRFLFDVPIEFPGEEDADGEVTNSIICSSSSPSRFRSIVSFSPSSQRSTWQ